MELKRSYADITRGRTSPGSERSAEDSGSGNVQKAPETASIQQGEAAVAIHDRSQSRRVSYGQPQYLLLDPGDLVKFIRSVEVRGKSEKLSKDALIGMDEKGEFTFHKKAGKSNKCMLDNFQKALGCCSSRLSEIQDLLCGYSEEFVKIADCVRVRDFNAFLKNTNQFRSFTDLYQYEVKLSKPCFEASFNIEEVGLYCNGIGEILKDWYSPLENKDAYRQYIKSFVDRSKAEFQGNESQLRVLHRVQNNLEKVLDCVETERLSGLDRPEQLTEQAPALESEISAPEGAVGFQRPLSMDTQSEDASLVQSMAGLDIDPRGAASAVASSRTLVCRPKSKNTGRMRYKVDAPLEGYDANHVLTKEILCEENALTPIFDSFNLFKEVCQKTGSDKNAFVCLNQSGRVRFVKNLSPDNREESLQFGKALREYEVWARVIFDFFHSKHQFYKAPFKDKARHNVQVQACQSLLNRYTTVPKDRSIKHPYSSVLRATFLLFKLVQEGKQEKVGQFAGILGRLVSAFATWPGDPENSILPGVNQSGPLATIASSGKVYCFFENVLRRCRRMRPEWHTQFDSVCEHFNHSLGELGINQRLT
ncbi:hypothetical protein [Kistimonas asteriae]|uniref:hypothetical protein n=1 Tax=Kistimonas asteriae TaxID=517724 RepID=UPI001BA91EBA|nr:hypothetical protein [Kistimonas asteriae]